eukprot:gb/GECG01011734.1/.p1 GENE.gb/GECG01011734.1/~~gb/GECG01011734.1/.p1  ORF type:complete len:818 (+),score=146.75 gb/GECG01011734.1/:1-2454(+)
MSGEENADLIRRLRKQLELANHAVAVQERQWMIQEDIRSISSSTGNIASPGGDASHQGAEQKGHTRYYESSGGKLQSPGMSPIRPGSRHKRHIIRNGQELVSYGDDDDEAESPERGGELPTTLEEFWNFNLNSGTGNGTNNDKEEEEDAEGGGTENQSPSSPSSAPSSTSAQLPQRRARATNTQGQNGRGEVDTKQPPVQNGPHTSNDAKNEPEHEVPPKSERLNGHRKVAASEDDGGSQTSRRRRRLRRSKYPGNRPRNPRTHSRLGKGKRGKHNSSSDEIGTTTHRKRRSRRQKLVTAERMKGHGYTANDATDKSTVGNEADGNEGNPNSDNDEIVGYNLRETDTSTPKQDMLVPIRRDDMVPGGFEKRSSRERKIAQIAQQRVRKLLSAKAKQSTSSKSHGNSPYLSCGTHSTAGSANRAASRQSHSKADSNSSSKTLDKDAGSTVAPKQETSFEVKRPSSMQIMTSYIRGAFEAFSTISDTTPKSTETREQQSGEAGARGDDQIREELSEWMRSKQRRKLAISLQHFDVDVNEDDENGRWDDRSKRTRPNDLESTDNILGELLEEEEEPAYELQQCQRKTHGYQHRQSETNKLSAEPTEDEAESSDTAEDDNYCSGQIQSYRYPHNRSGEEPFEDAWQRKRSSENTAMRHPLQRGVQCQITAKGENKLVHGETMVIFSSGDEDDGEDDGSNMHSRGSSTLSAYKGSVTAGSVNDGGGSGNAHRRRGSEAASLFGAPTSGVPSRARTKNAFFLRYGKPATTQSSVRNGQHSSQEGGQRRSRSDTPAGNATERANQALSQLLLGVEEEDYLFESP